eukprot:g4141.t1
MAAKRSAGKAAAEARKDAKEQQRQREMVTVAVTAEDASRMRAEEETRMMEKMARFASERKEQEEKLQEMARELGLRRRRAPPAPTAPNANLPLRHRVIVEGRRSAERQRELDTMAKLMKINSNLRRQVG